MYKQIRSIKNKFITERSGCESVQQISITLDQLVTCLSVTVEKGGTTNIGISVVLSVKNDLKILGLYATFYSNFFYSYNTK